MQNDSNVETVQAETSVSNAVLTPEQIHPNFFKMKKTHSHTKMNRKSSHSHLVPLSIEDIEQRKSWSIRQISVIANIPSTAILGA